MKKTHIPSLLAACLLVWSCSGPVAESTLRDVRSYIDEYPDSALAVLDTIPEGNLRGKKAEAEFALLYSMALDKNYIDMTDDSLINVAVRWYRRHGSADDRLKAWYYQGRVYQNAGDNERAMESFTRAERYVKRSGDCTTSGMLYSAKSRVYDYLFDIEKSSANLRRASEYYQLAKDTARYTGSILKLAGSSIVAEKTAEASAYLDTLGKYWDALSESKKSSCYSYMLELALIENRDTLAPIADGYISDIQDSSAINWITLAHVYLETGEYDKGLDALDAYRKTDTAYLADNAYLWLFSELSAEKGQYETAYQALHRYVSVTDETDVDIFESDAKFTEDRMLARYKLQNRNLWITIMLLGIISLISSGLLLYAKLQEKIHQKQQEKERLEREKHEIETEMESYRKLYEQAQEEKKNLLRIRQDQKLDKEIPVIHGHNGHYRIGPCALPCHAESPVRAGHLYHTVRPTMPAVGQDEFPAVLRSCDQHLRIHPLYKPSPLRRFLAYDYPLRGLEHGAQQSAHTGRPGPDYQHGILFGYVRYLRCPESRGQDVPHEKCLLICHTVRDFRKALVRIRYTYILRLSAVYTASKGPSAQRIGAVVHISVPAEEALSAECLHVDGHPVARNNIVHPASGLLHNAYHLMPHRYAGDRPGDTSVLDMKVTGTDAAQGHLHYCVPLPLQLRHRLVYKLEPPFFYICICQHDSINPMMVFISSASGRCVRARGRGL